MDPTRSVNYPTKSIATGTPDPCPGEELYRTPRTPDPATPTGTLCRNRARPIEPTLYQFRNVGPPPPTPFLYSLAIDTTREMDPNPLAS